MTGATAPGAAVLAHVGSPQAAAVVLGTLIGLVGFTHLSVPTGGRARTARNRRRRWAWDGGLLVIAVAELPPLGTYVDERFSVHMVQHLLFCFVAAPLLVLARPGPTFARLLDRPSGAVPRRSLLQPVGRTLGSPVVAWLFFVGYVWLVHFTGLYDLALDHAGVHLLEHAGFLAAAILLWRPILGPRTDSLPGPTPVLYVLVLMPAMAFCGLALFSADHVLYDAYGTSPSALADQRLGGALMWALPIVALLPAILALVVRWWRREEQAQALRDASTPWDGQRPVPVGRSSGPWR